MKRISVWIKKHKKAVIFSVLFLILGIVFYFKFIVPHLEPATYIGPSQITVEPLKT